jgi:peptidoglycan/LPS O-acetylase OafA/YrhL
MGERDHQTNTDIEVLRAIAVSFTLVAHLMWGIVPKLGPFGRELYPAFAFWTGVDLFFGISGFVITASLLRARRQFFSVPYAAARHDWANFLRFARPFWLRRVFRLLPSAWLWVAITAALAAFFNRYGSFGALHFNLREGIAALLNVANFYYYDWFARGNVDYGSLGIYWSLSLEEQFYFVFPILLFFVRRRTLPFVLATLFAVQFFIPRPNGFDAHPTSLLWFIRTDAICLGALIAMWQSRPSYRAIEPRFLRHRPFALAAVSGAMILLAGIPSFATGRYSTGLVALVSGGLVLIASYGRDYLFPPSRAKSILTWIGSRSYSIYLTHTVGRAVVLEVKLRLGVAEGSTAAALWSIGSLALILVLSEMNYRCVETPFRNLGRHVAARRRLRPEPIPVAEEATVAD